MSAIPRIERFGEKACKVSAGDNIFFFSYDTCVAMAVRMAGEEDDYAVSIAPPSATSARHMAMMGCETFRRVSPGEFNKIASGL